MNTNLDKITETLLQTMRKHKKEEIIPGRAVKNKLDRALAIKRHKNSVLSTRVPLYQAAAVAVIFFVFGFSSSFLRPVASPEIVHTTTEVVKYVDRPVTEICYVEVPVMQQLAIRDTGITQNITHTGTNESLGVSLQDDTILQKMLVTIY